jgi:hypothetical protein
MGHMPGNNVNLRNPNRIYSFNTPNNQYQRQISNPPQSLKNAVNDKILITNSKFNFKIPILSSEIKYSITSTMNRGITIEDPT